MKTINIPFVSGQDESFDKRLLDAGTLSRAENVTVVKGGQMARRRGLSTVTTSDVRSTPFDSNFLSLFGERGFLVDNTDCFASYGCHSHNSAAGTGESLVLTTDSVPTLIEPKWCGVKPPPKEANAKACFSDQTKDKRGRIITLTVFRDSTSNTTSVFLVLEIRDPETLAVIDSLKHTVSKAADADVIGAQVVCSTTTDRAYVALMMSATITTDVLLRQRFSLLPLTYIDGESVSVGGSPGPFQMVSVPGTDLVYIANVAPGGPSIIHSLYNISTGASVVAMTGITPASHATIGVAARAGTVYLAVIEYTASTPGNRTLTVRAYSLAGGAPSSTSAAVVASTTANDPDVIGVAADISTQGVWFGWSDAGCNSFVGYWDGDSGSTPEVAVRSTASRICSRPLPLSDYPQAIFMAGQMANDFSGDILSGFEMFTGDRAAFVGTLPSGKIADTSVGGIVDNFIIGPDRIGNSLYWGVRVFDAESSYAIGDYFSHFIVKMELGRREQGTVTRESCSLSPGVGMFASDGDHAFFAGWSGPPVITGLTVAAGSVDAGDVRYSIVMEYRDANGRVWRSGPSAPKVWTSGGSEQATVTFGTPAGSPSPGSSGVAVMYLSSEIGGTTLYRYKAVDVGEGSFGTFVIAGLASDTGEILYTQSGELGNDMPPSAIAVATTRERVWVIDGSRRARASKLILPERGIEWANVDNFYVECPSAITGIASMDDSVILMTKDGVFAVGGNGPNLQGVGEFSSPQKIPGNIGCINYRSVVTNEQGVFFQSARGLEFVSRGFSSPQWIGQAVRDVLDDYPECVCAVTDGKTGTVRWVFTNGGGTLSDHRVIVFESRSNGWFVHKYDTSEFGASIGTLLMGNVVDQGDLKAKVGLVLAGQSAMRREKDTEYGNFADSPNVIETGDLALAGLNGEVDARRVILIGRFRDDCVVTISFAFDGKEYLSGDYHQTTLTTADYSVDEPVQIEVSLPVQKFSSVRFKVSWTGNSSGESFLANGLSMVHEVEGEGTRLPERQKG